MTHKLVLIDGSSLLSTSFFGNLPNELKYAKTDEEKEKGFEKVMKTSDGRYTNGVYTMTKSILNIIKKQNPTHLCVAWDVNRNSLARKLLYPDYKGTRKETMPQLGAQFGLMQEVLDKMNIPQFKLEGHEADDIIGTFAKTFENEISVFVLSKDQDILQLITERTRVWLTTKKSSAMYKERGIDLSTINVPDGSFEYTPITFEEEYGIKPIQIIDLKALEGDTSDNIPGVKGVGKTSIVPLLNEYGTIEAIYEVIENTPEDELKKFFKEYLGIKSSPIAKLTKKSEDELVGKEAAFLSKELATIKTDLDEFKNKKLDELKLNFNVVAAKEVFLELEFKSLIDKLN